MLALSLSLAQSWALPIPNWTLPLYLLVSFSLFVISELELSFIAKTQALRDRLKDLPSLAWRRKVSVSYTFCLLLVI